jgi:hypothetical protein
MHRRADVNDLRHTQARARIEDRSARGGLRDARPACLLSVLDPAIVGHLDALSVTIGRRGRPSSVRVGSSAWWD